MTVYSASIRTALQYADRKTDRQTDIVQIAVLCSYAGEALQYTLFLCGGGAPVTGQTDRQINRQTFQMTIPHFDTGGGASVQYADVIDSPVTDVFTLTRPLIEFSLTNVRRSFLSTQSVRIF